MVMGMHPSASLLGWLILMPVCASQPVPRLYWVAALLVGVAWIGTGLRFRALVRRSRWLFLAIVVFFAGMTPGRTLDLLPFLTVDGLRMALEHSARLVVALAMVAILMAGLPARALLSGLYGLLVPLRPLGLAADRFVLRLGLVLQALEPSPPPMPDRVDLDLPAWRGRDAFGVCCLVAVAAAANW